MRNLIGLVVLVSFQIGTVTSEPRYDNRVITSLKHSSNHIKAEPLIVNGIRAREGQVPYLVSIKDTVKRIKNTKLFLWSNLCGGSIIGEKKVLTAGHCFERKNFFLLDNLDQLIVVAGSLLTDLQHSGVDETNDKYQVRKLRKVYIHKRYNFPTNDVAVVYTVTSWKFNGNVGYIRYDRRTTDYTRSCRTAGFGDTSTVQTKTNITTSLLTAEITVLPRIACSFLWEMDMTEFICSDSVVTDVSRGDSGGPLVCYTSKYTERTKKPVLVGVVSGKNYDKTTLYTRLSEHLDFIDDPTSVAPVIGYNVKLLLLSFIVIYLCSFS